MPNLMDLKGQVEIFIDSYNILSPEGKALFEAQLGKSIHTSDQNTKMLFRSLNQAAKDGLTVEEAIEKMSRSVNVALRGTPGDK